MDPHFEIARYLQEKIWIANYPMTHPQRELLHQVRMAQAIREQQNGKMTDAYFHFIQALRLSPQTLDSREKYSLYLRESLRNVSYLEELKLIRELKKGEDFALDTRLEKLNRKYRDLPTIKHNIDLYTLNSQREPIIVFLPPPGENYNLSDNLGVLGNMLSDAIGLSDNYTVSWHTPEEKIPVLNKSSVNYYTEFQADIQDKMIRLKTSVWYKPTRTMTNQIEKTYSGEHRFLKAVRDSYALINETIPRTGRIIKRFDNEYLLTDLGQLNGVTNRQLFKVNSGTRGNFIGYATVTEIDDYMSVLKLSNAREYSYMQKGDLIQQ